MTIATISHVHAARPARLLRRYLSANGKQTLITKENGQLQLVLDPALTSDFEIMSATPLIVRGKTEAALFQGALYALEQPKPSAMTAQISERCVMLDIGRKFYPLSALKQLVVEMTAAGFNQLQLHFSENEGFRIESERYPEILSAHYLTKAEIRELILFAQDQYIEIIPDFDSPGHLRKILAHHPEWQLPMKKQDGPLTTDKKALDILNPEAVSFIHSIYAEYAELFCQSRYFHIGADEFVEFDKIEDYPTLSAYAKETYGQKASGIEVFIEYVNKTIDFINSLGFIPRVWNDGFFRLNRDEQLLLSPDCQISYWTRWNKNMAPITTFFEKGYQVVNHNDNYLYYVLGEAAGYTYPTYDKIKEEFALNLFASGQKASATEMKQVPAVALAVWADVPTAKEAFDVIADLRPLMQAIKEKTYR